MMPAIPRAVLTMGATLYARTADDDYGNPSYGSAITLSNLYIEPTRNVNAGQLGEQARYDMVLYFDCANSLPAGQVFTDKDKITFNGKDYNVRTARELYDPTIGKLHHWEVRLYAS